MKRREPTFSIPENTLAADAFPALTLPSPANTAWVVETEPEGTAAWLAGLPFADPPQAAQQLYQALFTLNRMSFDMNDRLRLMELYRVPVAMVTTALRSQLQTVSLPLRPRFKQLADFLNLLQLETSYGYKHVLADARDEAPLAENEAVLLAVARALECLGQVLLQAYHVYVPVAAGVWREIHGLYRYAEFHERQQQSLAALNQNEPLGVERAYLQTLMLALSNPYQLPPGECFSVHAFLSRWVDRASLSAEIEGTDPLGHFLLDLETDHPASPFPRDVSVHNQPALRAINAIELARVVHGFAARLQKRELIRTSELGFDCTGPVCMETLKRMLRAWGLAARRQFARRERRQPLSVCIGLPAVHFFISGQRQVPVVAPGQGGGSAVIPSQAELDADARGEANVSTMTYRVDNRWQLRDESASGMLLARSGDLGPFVHVGDLIGITNPEGERWRLGIARWVKSPSTKQVEMGVEMLAPEAQALVMRPQGVPGAPYEPVLILPSVPTLKRPAMLLAARGTIHAGEAFELMDGQSVVRSVHILSIAERSANFVQAVFADAAR